MQETSKADPSPSSLQPLLTIPQIATILGVSRPTVYELINEEGLPFVKLRKNIRVIPVSFQLWLIGREQDRK